MSDWQSYRLEDFIPFTPEVYFRLIERINEAWWPLHILAILWGLGALALAWRGRALLALGLLAPAWGASGIVFHMQGYAELNWAGVYFGWAFVVQALLMLVLAAFGHGSGVRPGGTPIVVAGAAIALFGLVGYPAIAPLTGHDWVRAELFALHPDPTVVTSLGIVLLVLTGPRALIASLLPLAWLVVTTLTLVAMQVAWAWMPALIGLVALVGVVTALVFGRHDGVAGP